MFNAIQERKRCKRLVIIPWRKTVPFQELIGDHFGVDVKSGVGIISGSNCGRSFRGLYRPLEYPLQVVTLRKFYMHALAYTCHKPGCDSKRCHQGVPNTFHEPIRIVSGDDKEYER